MVESDAPRKWPPRRDHKMAVEKQTMAANDRKKAAEGNGWGRRGPVTKGWSVGMAMGQIQIGCSIRAPKPITQN
jgi:hypothetical protein